MAAGDGYVVVGSEDGKVRLYSSNTLTMAKTAIPGLGASITSVDVTYDGKWVLATTGKYVMVVKTTFKDKSGRCASSNMQLCSEARCIASMRYDINIAWIA